MTHTPVTSEEISGLLGDAIDPIVVHRIADTGASIDEIAEAMAMVDSVDRGGGAPVREASSPRVVEVRHILAELVLDGADEDDGDTQPGTISMV